MTFQNLDLLPSLLDAVSKEGYTIPTPIQEQSIPQILRGMDIFGCARTGTGKTAAFALPLIQLIIRDASANKNSGIKALVLAPTRELAHQINESFLVYGRGSGIKTTCIYGGVSQNSQVASLKAQVDVLVATPGRLLDLLNQKLLQIDSVKYFVLDEADRMLDMGFIHDIRRIIARLPEKRQTLFFSATVSKEVWQLAGSMLHNPVQVSVIPKVSETGQISETVYYVKKEDKLSLLKHVIEDHAIPHALVFTRTKHGADKVARALTKTGITAEAIHGNKSQSRRETNLNGFKTGNIRVLVATDIASRGIDIERLSHVINYEIPDVAETYVHRIGRTGRAGAQGIALSFCSADERQNLEGIKKLVRRNIRIVGSHPYSG